MTDRLTQLEALNAKLLEALENLLPLAEKMFMQDWKLKAAYSHVSSGHETQAKEAEAAIAEARAAIAMADEYL